MQMETLQMRIRSRNKKFRGNIETDRNGISTEINVGGKNERKSIIFLCLERGYYR